MRLARFIIPFSLVILSLVAGVAAGLRLTRPHYQTQSSPNTGAVESAKLKYQSQTARGSDRLLLLALRQANILELPKASSDFVGYWGGYIRSSIQRLSPDLVGASPNTVHLTILIRLANSIRRVRERWRGRSG
jgi:hypothetical protein